jgi:hypothetical protein
VKYIVTIAKDIEIEAGSLEDASEMAHLLTPASTGFVVEQVRAAKDDGS